MLHIIVHSTTEEGYALHPYHKGDNIYDKEKIYIQTVASRIMIDCKGAGGYYIYTQCNSYYTEGPARASGHAH